jgi:hypothetical protein
MNSFFANCGVVSVGDMVSFEYPSGKKTGKVVELQETINSICASIYCLDNTGGYTLSVPHFNITEKVEDKKEDIEKPTRYNKRGKLECWDVILDQEMNFLEGNILKYLWRYKEKKGVEDLKKARVYLDKLISEVDKK